MENLILFDTLLEGCLVETGKNACPTKQNEKARRALPFATGFPLVAYLRYYRGD